MTHPLTSRRADVAARRHTTLLLLACCSAGAHAQSPRADTSNVQIYGLIDAYAGSMRRSGQVGRTEAVNSGGMNTTFWGVRGSEDLGAGLRASFSIESFFQLDTGAIGRNATDPYFSKNAWVGVSGAFGQISAGRQTNPLFLVTGNFNPYGTSLSFSPVMLQVWQPTYNRAVLGDSVWNNTVQLSSPELAGFRANLLYGLGEVPDRSSVRNINLTVNYKLGPFAAAVAAQQAMSGPGFDTRITKQDVRFVGASYDLANTRLYAQYLGTRTPDLRSETDTVQLGASVTLGAGSVLLSVARTDRDTTGAPTQRRTLAAIGYDHNLSKRTDVYAIVMNDKLTGAASAATIGVGVRHRF